MLSPLALELSFQDGLGEAENMDCGHLTKKELVQSSDLFIVH